MFACKEPNLDGALEAVILTPSEWVPAAPTLSWSGPAGEAFVEYGLDGELDLSTPNQAVDGEVSQALLGLKSGRTYSYRAVTLTEDGERLESGVGTFDVPLAPVSLPRIEVSANDDDLSDGFLLTAVLQDGPGQVIMLDRDGDVVWWFELGDTLSITSQRLSHDGRAVMAMVSDKEQGSDLGGLWRVELDGTAAEQTRLIGGHHDFIELPDGRIAWLSVVQSIHPIDGQDVNIISDRVLAAAPGSDDPEPEVLFDMLEDYSATPSPSCAHFVDGAYGITGRDWTHSNSLALIDDDQTLLIGARNLDTVIAADLDTAEVLWQMGGLDSDLILTDGLPWNHAHFSEVWDGGMLMMDNGDHRRGQVSRAVEYSWDVEAGTYTEVRAVDHPRGRWVRALGDVRSIGDDLLIAWSTAGQIHQVGPGGDIRWEVASEIGVIFGRVRWIDDLYSIAD